MRTLDIMETTQTALLVTTCTDKCVRVTWKGHGMQLATIPCEFRAYAPPKHGCSIHTSITHTLTSLSDDVSL